MHRSPARGVLRPPDSHLSAPTRSVSPHSGGFPHRKTTADDPLRMAVRSRRAAALHSDFRTLDRHHSTSSRHPPGAAALSSPEPQARQPADRSCRDLLSETPPPLLHFDYTITGSLYCPFNDSVKCCESPSDGSVRCLTIPARTPVPPRERFADLAASRAPHSRAHWRALPVSGSVYRRAPHPRALTCFGQTEQNRTFFFRRISVNHAWISKNIEKCRQTPRPPSRNISHFPQSPV